MGFCRRNEPFRARPVWRCTCPGWPCFWRERWSRCGGRHRLQYTWKWPRWCRCAWSFPPLPAWSQCPACTPCPWWKCCDDNGLLVCRICGRSSGLLHTAPKAGLKLRGKTQTWIIYLSTKKGLGGVLNVFNMEEILIQIHHRHVKWVSSHLKRFESNTWHLLNINNPLFFSLKYIHW